MSTEAPSLAERPLTASPDYPPPQEVPAGYPIALPKDLLTKDSLGLIDWIHSHWTSSGGIFRFDTSTHGDASVVAPLLPPDLEDALADLRAAPNEARDEGYPRPTQRTFAEADRILRWMHGRLAARLEVYPTPDGDIAIVAPGGPRHSVMVLCDPSGGALCMVNMDGEHRRARYATAERLPDGFLLEALNELATHRDG